MKRSTIDKLLATSGIVIAVLLLLMTGALVWAHNFVHTQVTDQLSAQQIFFPAEGSEGITTLPAEDQPKIAKYAGQQLTTGAQAEAYADHFIAVHLVNIGGGKTYAQLSAASMADPTDAKLVGQVQTVFKGETLRGLLLNAYAFDTMAILAGYAAYGTFAAAVLLLILSALGFLHAGKAATPAKKRK